MLDHQDGNAQLVLDVLNPEGHVVGFLHVEPGRGLVEQQQFGFGTQGAGQLNDLAHAIRQARHHGVAVVLQVKKIDDLFGFFTCPEFCIACFGGEKQVMQQTGLPVRGIKSATVICANAEIADAMATPVMIMGINVALDMINQVQGMSCLLIDDNNKVYTSKNINLR